MIKNSPQDDRSPANLHGQYHHLPDLPVYEMNHDNDDYINNFYNYNDDIYYDVNFNKHIKCYPNGLTHNLSLNTKQQKSDLTLLW